MKRKTVRLLDKLSYTSAYYVQTKKKESHEYKRILYFGFQAIYSDIMKFSIIGCISVALNSFITSAIVTLTFVLLRKYAGGVHMKTELKCTVLSVLLMILPGTLIEHKLNNLNFEIVTIVILATFVITYLCLKKYAPKDCLNRPISKEESVVFKRKSIFSLYLIVVTAFVLTILNNYKLAFAICTSCIMEILTLVPPGYATLDMLNKVKLHKKCKKC